MLTSYKSSIRVVFPIDHQDSYAMLYTPVLDSMPFCALILIITYVHTVHTYTQVTSLLFYCMVFLLMCIYYTEILQVHI